MNLKSPNKVKRIRTYNGVHVKATVLTGVDETKDKVEMYLLPIGVSILSGPPWSDKIVPFANVCEIDIANPLLQVAKESA